MRAVYLVVAGVSLGACGSADESGSAATTSSSATAGSGAGASAGGTGGSGASGAGGDGATGGGGTGDRFPLGHTEGERFLREASGKPFFFHGDSAWSLIAELTEEDAALYLDDRREKGFSVLLVSLLEHQFSDQAPANAYGEAPFTSGSDYSTPNEAYFAHADWVIDAARDRGLLVLLTPSYIGYGGGDEGFYQEMIANGPAKLEGYGHFLGKRYASKPNILWVNAGDYDPPAHDLVEAIANGIRAEDPAAFQTAHTSRGEAASDVWGGEPWLDVDNVYTDADSHGPSLALHRATTKPFFLIEAYYEGEHEMTEGGVRDQAYGALLGGAMGQIFGNNPIWCFGAATCFPTSASPPTWQAQLDGRGSKDMAALAQILEPLDWYRLEPDATLVTQDSTGAIGARAADGSLALLYTRSLGSLDVDLSGFSGPVQADRIDPTTAAATSLSPSPFPNSGTQTLELDQTNATGTEDWVVRLSSP